MNSIFSIQAATTFNIHFYPVSFSKLSLKIQTILDKAILNPAKQSSALSFRIKAFEPSSTGHPMHTSSLWV
jgi:hypothetical protein